jgi:hypothetical protein
MPLGARANDFPTLDRVDHVLTCMKKHGGQTLDNLYACSCELDVIASIMPHDEFVEATTFAMYKGMPGERGSVFRDSKRGQQLTAKLEKAGKEASRRCFLRGGGSGKK